MSTRSSSDRYSHQYVPSKRNAETTGGWKWSAVGFHWYQLSCKGDGTCDLKWYYVNNMIYQKTLICCAKKQTHVLRTKTFLVWNFFPKLRTEFPIRFQLTVISPFNTVWKKSGRCTEIIELLPMVLVVLLSKFITLHRNFDILLCKVCNCKCIEINKQNN